MKPIPERIDRDEFLERASQRICQAVYRVDVGRTLTEGEPLVKEELTNLKIQEVLDKIKEFVDSEKSDDSKINH